MRVHLPAAAAKAAAHIVLALWGLTTLFPFLWVVNNAFKPAREIMSHSFELPREFTAQNFTDIFGDKRIPILQAYANSFAISGIVCAVVIVCASLMAFGLTRYAFRLNRPLFLLLIAAQMFPAFATIIPVFKIITALRLLNNILSVALVQIAGNLPFATIVLVSYMRGLPVELEEAAFLEGCGVFRILYKVIVPITKPAFATVAIFSFIWSYNDLFTQIFFLRDKQTGYTINRLLNEVSSLDGGTNYGRMAASVVLIVIPVIVIYMILQKNIIKGLTAGAVKG